MLAKTPAIVAMAVALAAGHLSVKAQGPNRLPNRLGPSQQTELGPAGPKLGDAVVQRWKLGVEITAQAPCVGIFATAPVPVDWPEQKVQIVEEEISPEVAQVGYRTLDDGVTQMLVHIPQLAPGRTAKALVTVQITRHVLLPPDNPQELVLPRRVPSSVRKWLGASPYIETRSAEIRRKAQEIVQGKESAWEQVEAIYDWVRENVKYQNGPLKGALAALRDGTGDCEELTSLFIAMCRVNRIPARTVWVPNHCYPEFYLEDKDGNGYWIPCQAAGTRSFGGIPEQRPILQKGDNFTVPEIKQPQRYVAEFLQVKSISGAQPEVKFIRELLPAR
ncbi:MAG: transglutaminase [Pirellulaceae bacterium]|nr:MAG: transglutaminase [Pirellulaceae bacterium]